MIQLKATHHTKPRQSTDANTEMNQRPGKCDKDLKATFIKMLQPEMADSLETDEK